MMPVTSMPRSPKSPQELPEFDYKKVNVGIPVEAQQTLFLFHNAFVFLEGALTEWLIRLTGMNDDIGKIMMGRMDNRAKFDKLNQIYKHLKNTKAIASIRSLEKSVRHCNDLRNLVAHNLCWGMEGEFIVFLTNRYPEGDPNSLATYRVKPDAILGATKFALHAAAQIRSMWQPAPPPQSPECSPLSPLPTLFRFARNKRPPPPRSSRASP
jgi:hypothetical protein